MMNLMPSSIPHQNTHRLVHLSALPDHQRLEEMTADAIAHLRAALDAVHDLPEAERKALLWWAEALRPTRTATFAPTARRRALRSASECQASSSAMSKSLPLAGLRDGLMQPAAYATFREDFERHLKATQSDTEDTLRLLDSRIRDHEKMRAYLMKAVESGAFGAPVIERLNQVDTELMVMKSGRVAAEPAPVELPENLLDLYRDHITTLVETLSDENVAANAGDELRELIDRIVVRHDALQGHSMELEGKIVELVQAGSAKARSPAVGGAFGGVFA